MTSSHWVSWSRSHPISDPRSQDMFMIMLSIDHVIIMPITSAWSCITILLFWRYLINSRWLTTALIMAQIACIGGIVSIFLLFLISKNTILAIRVGLAYIQIRCAPPVYELIRGVLWHFLPPQWSQENPGVLYLPASDYTTHGTVLSIFLDRFPSLIPLNSIPLL